MRAKRRITLLVEPLPVLLHGAHAELELPALRTIASRGNVLRDGPAKDLSGFDADATRCVLFGLDGAGNHTPVAALQLMATNGQSVTTESFYLRLDPVTLSVDRVSVLMSGHGFADLDSSERERVATVITTALAREGLQVISRCADGWILALSDELAFAIPPLSAALGADCAELLPEQPETLIWKRILNEVQMDLHACAVNQRRRESGRREINSVWFWGGGAPPAASNNCLIRSVISDHPVSRGLAVLQGCLLEGLTGTNFAEMTKTEPEAFDILIDWEGPRTSAEADLLALEHTLQHLTSRVRREDLELHLIDGSGGGWSFNRRCARRFWRKPAALRAAPFRGHAG